MFACDVEKRGMLRNRKSRAKLFSRVPLSGRGAERRESLGTKLIERVQKDRERQRIAQTTIFCDSVLGVIKKLADPTMCRLFST